MKRLETQLEGPILLEPLVHGDRRGFFHESYRRNVFGELGITDDFVQENHSRSQRGVLRGMHFQTGPGMAKLIRCTYGSIFDAVVDLRRGSPSYGRWEAFQLDDRKLHQLYVPVGFAHGFYVTSESADVVYRCSAYYEPAAERGISYADPDVGIRWPEGPVITSERDASAPRLREVEEHLPFVYGR